MSIIFKMEVERLQGLLDQTPKDAPEYAEYEAELKHVEKLMSEYKPSEVKGGVCVSCEG
jgi:hypothetical protein